MFKLFAVYYKNKSFSDDSADGMEGLDYRIDNEKIEFSGKLSPEKQLEIAKDYTENLKHNNAWREIQELLKLLGFIYNIRLNSSNY